MTNFVVRFTSDIILTYNLIPSDTTTLWKNEIVKFNVNDCDKAHHYSSYATKEQTRNKINRLCELANIINQYAENKIQIQDITDDNFRDTLSIMHVHFPEMSQDPNYAHLRSTLAEYNDTIHLLEVTVDKDPNDSSIFQIILGLNTSPKAEYFDIPIQDYSMFTPYLNFGGLYLGYPHIGRHAQELFFANDLICPKEQFIPQTKLTATVSMHFMNNFHVTEEAKDQFNKAWADFYQKRGGKEFWGYDINDPKLALGNLKIGQLSSITKEGKEYTIPNTLEELNLFRQLLVNTEVVDWFLE